MKYTQTKTTNLYLHPNGTYYFVKGKIERSLKTDDLKTALKKMKLHEVRYDEYKSGNFYLTPKDIEPEYIEYRRDEMLGKIKGKKKIRPATFKETQDQMRLHILPYFGKMKLSEIDSMVWDDYRRQAKVTDLANQRKVLGHFLKWCSKRRYIKSFPILDLDENENRRPRRILTPEEIALILPHTSGNIRLFVMFALGLGMRRSEIIKLSWDRIDLDALFITLRKEDTKTNSAREIPFGQLLCQILKARKLEQGGKTKWVFPNRKDQRRHADVSGLKTAWATCLRNAFEVKKGSEPDITFHDLRATRENYAHKRADLSKTQLEKFFGANVEIQRKTYVKFKADDVRDVLNDQIFQGLIEESGKSPVKSND